MEMPDQVRRTWRAKWLRLHAIYVPIMVGIPTLLEFGDTTALFAHKAEKVVTLLTITDVYVFGLAIMMYTYLRKLVSRVEYDIEQDKVILH